MKAFISYSHNDDQTLNMFHKHLTQLQREGIITTWTDEAILAGGSLNENISAELNTANLFIALLSPDYIASKYCYEKEFQKALGMQQQGKIIIIPIIVESCDWLSTPFKEFKALPKDGKAISTWENKNTAFLDVIQNIRQLVESTTDDEMVSTSRSSVVSVSRNYRVQKDFDSIHKMEFIEKTFQEIKEYVKRYVAEILQIDNIRGRLLIDTDSAFEYLLVNRNKIATESQLKLTINSEESAFRSINSIEKRISYSITRNNRPSVKSFTLAFDEYHLYWSESNLFPNSRDKKELGSKEIADIIWNEWLDSVGIL